MENTYLFPENAAYEAIARALIENYESIYDIDVESGAYICCHESEPYKELLISDKGDDFFASMEKFVPRVIHPDDRRYVLKMLERDTLITALQKDKYYSLVYRLIIDRHPVYHKIRATMDTINGREHILLGVRDVDETIKQEQLHEDTLNSMFQKEKNHLEAILGSAAGYLEVNLSQDKVLEISPYLPSGKKATAADIPELSDISVYSILNKWVCDTQIVKGLEKFQKISSIDYLLNCFARGEKRASVYFSSRKKDGGRQPCREVFYLYQDHASGDIMAFCVIYDLTEEQRKEKELQLSRIRNFTSQMQPHFLYNALGAIQEIVLDDPQYASELISDFTVHLRSCIKAMSDDRPLPFSQEMMNIKAYVNIEKMRFGEKLKVEYDIQVQDFLIIPLTIQPLVENAIRHGIYERGAKGGTVKISSQEKENAWVITIEDDGVGFDVEAYYEELRSGEKDSTGLRNIRFRLETLMNASIDVTSVVGTGTKVIVSIPKKETN